MYVHHNAQEKMAMLKGLSSRVLVVWGGLFFKTYDAIGMRATEQRPLVEGAIQHRQVLEFENCVETVGTQNATALATAIRQLVGQKS